MCARHTLKSDVPNCFLSFKCPLPSPAPADASLAARCAGVRGADPHPEQLLGSCVTEYLRVWSENYLSLAPQQPGSPVPLLQQPLRPLSLPRRAGRAPARLLRLWKRAEERAGRSALQGAGPYLPCVPRRWETASSLRPGSSGCRSTGSSRRQEQAADWFHSADVNRRGVRLGPVRWPGRAWRLSGMPPA